MKETFLIFILFYEDGTVKQLPLTITNDSIKAITFEKYEQANNYVNDFVSIRLSGFKGYLLGVQIQKVFIRELPI